MKGAFKTIGIIIFIIIIFAGIVTTYFFATVGTNGSQLNGAIAINLPKTDATIPKAETLTPMAILEKNILNGKEQQRLTEISAPPSKPMTKIILPSAFGTNIMREELPSNDASIETKNTISRVTKTENKKNVLISDEPKRDVAPENRETGKNKNIKEPIKEPNNESNYTFLEITKKPSKVENIDPDIEQNNLSKSKEKATIKNSNAIFLDEDVTIFTSVLGDQSVTVGEMIKVRVTDAFMLADIEVPKHTIMKGRVTLSSDRLNISVTVLMINGKPFKVNYEGSDPTDMMVGIAIDDPAYNNQKRTSEENMLAQTANTLGSSMGGGALGIGQMFAEGTNLQRIKNNKITIKNGQKIIFNTVPSDY